MLRTPKMLHAPLAMVPFAAICIAQPTSAQPQYDIVAVSLPGQANSNGQGVSPNGTFVTGTSNNDAVRWTESGGTVLLPALASPARPFSLAQAVSDSGIVVGTGATTFFGSSPLPIMWTDEMTVVSLPLPAGESIGRANAVADIKGVPTATGSVDGGSFEEAATFTTSGASKLSQTMPNGGRLTTAFGINSDGRIVGTALNPTSAAVTNAFYVDPGDASATDIGALTALGHNSAIAFAVSSDGRIAGSSSINSGADARPFVWDETTGMTEVPLLPATTTGSARGINADGWAVGVMASVTSIVFVYNGEETYAAQDLIPEGTGWDLTGGTSNGAFGIADNGVITGRGLLNGQITAFVMTPAGDCPADVNDDGDANPADFTAWLACFNNPKSAPYCARADVNGSGDIDPADFTAWLAAFNAGCP